MGEEGQNCKRVKFGLQLQSTLTNCNRHAEGHSYADDIDVENDQQMGCGDDANDSRCGQIGVYVANITVYGDKAKDLIEKRLVAEHRGERAILACLQEHHLAAKDCDKEANRLMQLGWKSSWTEGFANSDGTGVSPGSVIVAAGLRIDFSAEHLYGVLGVAKGATPMQQKATPWDCPDCPFGIVKLKGYQFLLVNVYLTAHIRATGDNTH